MVVEKVEWGVEMISSVQPLSHIQIFVTPWTEARWASLSITNSWSLLKLISIKSVMPSNRLILCHPLLLLPQSFPALGSFPVSQFFASGGQRIGVSASVSVLSMNIQEWFPLGWTGLNSLQSKKLSRVFNTKRIGRCISRTSHLAFQAAISCGLLRHCLLGNPANVCLRKRYWVMVGGGVVFPIWFNGKESICWCWRCEFDA